MVRGCIGLGLGMGGRVGATVGIAVCCAGLFAVHPAAAAQVEQPERIVRTGHRVQIGLATVFSFNREDAFCPEGSFVDATQLSARVYDAGARRVKGFGLEVTYVGDGQFPWPWADRASISMDHDGGLRVTGNAYLTVQRGARVDVDFLVGGGFRRWGEGDGVAEYTREPADGVYRIQSQTDPIITYGLLVDFSLSDAVSLQGQLRLNTTFTGDLAVVGPVGESEAVAAGTQTFAHLAAGLGVRVGGR